jgi:hypothetical protein
MYIDTLPTELIELICLWAAESAFEESEVREFPDLYWVDSSQKDRFLCSTLYPLPLIHPRWTASGQKALYRYVKLSTADRYKAFQDSLTTYPNNGDHVRAVIIQWETGDFGGPDGYAYKVLGWFHEMDIQHVIRLCPRLEHFDPGQNSFVISQEGMAALGTLNGVRSIAWRNEDFHRDANAVQINLRWSQLETFRIHKTLDSLHISMMLPIFNRIKKLIIHDSMGESQLPWSSMESLRNLELSSSSHHTINSPLKILRQCPTQLTHLTIRNRELDFSDLSMILNLESRLQYIQITLMFRPEDQVSDKDNLLHSDSLVEMIVHPSLYYIFMIDSDQDQCLRSRVRMGNFPQLMKLTKISWNSLGEPSYRSLLPLDWKEGLKHQ